MPVSWIPFVLATLFVAAANPQGGSTSPKTDNATTQSQVTAPATEPGDWRAATREDILAAYDIFKLHHPGMFDPNNPGFPAQLRRARDAALAFLPRVHDDEGHMRALAVFSAGLADDHAHIVAGYNGHGWVWPGFRAVWRSNRLFVLNSTAGGPPRGSILLACDRRNARTLIRQFIIWDEGRPNEEGQWWVHAPFFFWRERSAYDALPHECAFRTPGSRIAKYRLNWRPTPEDIVKEQFEQFRRQPIGLTEAQSRIYWITLSTFSPDTQGRAAYDRLFADLETQKQRIAAAKAIVIDLRNNPGGSSSWSESVADHLWGKDAVQEALAKYFQHTRIWWLADSANISHFQEAAIRFRAEGRAETADHLDKVAANLAAALKSGKRFYIDDFGASLMANAKPAVARRLPPIYIITDGSCASACLDAVDVFTRFPGVKLMGAPTSADSNYLDVRLEPLPSQRAGVWLPTKIWVDRPRRAGEVYRPDIPINELEWSTAKMLEHIESDLNHR